MSRIRTLKPEWAEDERLCSCSSDARTLSVALIVMADDYGRGRVGPGTAARCFPTKPSLFGPALEELTGWFLRTYTVRGQRYFEITNWTKHQRIDNAGKPRTPEPSEGSYDDETGTCGDSPRTSANLRDTPPDRDPDQDQDQDQDLPFASSSEIQTTPPDEALITVECVGGSWTLRRSKLDEWEGTFGEVVDVASEVRAALQWLRDNPAKRKTPKGMARFIGSWLRRAVDSGRARPRSAGRSQGLSAEEILRLAAEDDAA